MAAPAPHSVPVSPDTLITVKVIIDGSNRRLKLALRDLGAHVLPQKLRFLLAVPPDAQVIFERYSDSAGAYIALDSNNPSIYKQLYRAAKAKLKLRIKATVIKDTAKEQPMAAVDATSTAPPCQPFQPRHSYLDTVLSSPPYKYIPLSKPESAAANASSTTLGAQTLQGVDCGCEKTGAASATPVKVDQQDNVTVKSQPFMPQNGAFGLRNVMFSHATLPTPHDFPTGQFCIDCNNCGKSIPNEHYHCGICDGGDYDLCQACIDAGYDCGIEGHWLIKRFVRNGMVINSTTETIAPKKSTKPEPKVEVFSEPAPVQEEHEEESGLVERTCNACVNEFSDAEFVTCTDCPDYDLCLDCLVNREHGHHPGHTFKLVCEDRAASSDRDIMSLCQPGRDMRHRAICDGCDKIIVGVRHKCLTCPDWDYCPTCVMSASHIHPGHRFVPVYEAIAEHPVHTQIHYGIYCDGPLCKGKDGLDYVIGDRYKCAVCDDTDFCAKCEAVPVNRHNRTHPLIKFKTPVRHVSVTTLGEKGNGERMMPMGDRRKTKSTATETSASVNAATQVQTVAEVKPVEEPIVEEKKSESPAKVSPPAPELQAYFMRDTIPDGSKLSPSQLITQCWTLYNPGPLTWPAGCSVHYIGGDGMLNVDSKHPSSVSAIKLATESNVLEYPVEPGKSADFRVLLKTPQREGKAISYWRLKTPDGMPFGHKLWCDIDVHAAVASEGMDDRRRKLHLLQLELLRKEASKRAQVEKEETDTKVDGQDKIAQFMRKESDPNIIHIPIEITKKEVDVNVPVTLEEAKKDPEIKTEDSAMIFPKLEKESPVSSTHEAITAPAPTKPTVSTEEEQELLEDVESLELEEEETDDGFLTDEEYDILDASDEEFLAEAQKAEKK